MFDSPPDSTDRPRFRLDPWAAEYGGALAFEEAEEEEAERSDTEPDTAVETTDWSAGIRPSPTGAPARTVFVDGVQRADAWGRFETANGTVEAALASVAVGAVSCEEGLASLNCGRPARVLALSGGFSAEPIVVPTRGPDLRFEPSVSETRGHKGVSDAISRRRADIERRCAEQLVEDDALVVLDGRLSFDPRGPARVVGLAKTIHKQYLQGEHWHLVGRLAAGERTPVFRIKYGDTTRYSWYLRLPFTRPVHHSLAGIVRLETPEIGVEAAVRLADLTAAHLPRFASQPQHDPRAPQNLYPVGALERRLRHEMGDARWIRRLIEDHLHEESRP